MFKGSCDAGVQCRVIGHCRSCEELDNKARLRADYSTYRLMLRNIKRSEELYNDGSHIIFLMQVSNYKYITVINYNNYKYITVIIIYQIITVGDGLVLSS